MVALEGQGDGACCLQLCLVGHEPIAEAHDPIGGRRDARVMGHDQQRLATIAGGTQQPEDRALYTCVCGHAFKASVTTSVECPRCHTERPW